MLIVLHGKFVVAKLLVHRTDTSEGIGIFRIVRNRSVVLVERFAELILLLVAESIARVLHCSGIFLRGGIAKSENSEDEKKYAHLLGAQKNSTIHVLNGQY